MKSKNTILFLLLLTLGLAGCNEVSSELNSSPSIEDNSSSKESITSSVKPSEPSTIPSESSDIPSEPSQEPEPEKSASHPPAGEPADGERDRPGPAPPAVSGLGPHGNIPS